MNDVVTSNKPAHLWAKGKSGNPAGRPKGSKNAISLIKIQLEGELRSRMRPHMHGVVEELIRQALPKKKLDKEGKPVMDGDGNPVLIDGNLEAIKVLYQSWVSKTVSKEDEAPAERIQIVIGKLDQVPPVSGRVITPNEE